jgi:epoxyqueuosine reductase
LTADQGLAWTYRHHAYDQVNPRLDQVTLQLARALQRSGHRALNVPASQQVDKEQICGVFSHKMAAHLAGLGWIGKSCMLITPEMGPRVRWGTVLTDAPLPVTGGPADERCGTCQDCVDICPVEAYTGRAFRADEPRKARFDARKCQRYFQEMESAGTAHVCGLCLYVCPHGRSRTSSV